MSYATRRMVQGQVSNMSASRFATCLGGTFLARSTGFDTPEIQEILSEIAQL
jgi:hypothetical protein